MKTKKTLEQELSIAEQAKQVAENKVLDIQEKIKKRNDAKKPKSIIDRVKTLQDVLKIAKPSKEELAIINYKGSSKRLSFAKSVMIVSLISEVLNEGEELKVDGKTERHYPYFYVSSGFVFYRTSYDDTYADATSASRLALKNSQLAEYSVKQFFKYHKALICG